jgi:hypothetical protein
MAKSCRFLGDVQNRIEALFHSSYCGSILAWFSTSTVRTLVAQAKDFCRCRTQRI